MNRLRRLLEWHGYTGGRRRQAVTLGVVLALTLVFVGALALQGWRAMQAHRRAAEGAMRDYASVAAWNFAYRVRSLIFLGVTPVLGFVDDTLVPSWSVAQPKLRAASDSIERCQCAPWIRPLFFFRVALNGGAQTVDVVDSAVTPLVAARVKEVQARAIARIATGAAFTGAGRLGFATAAATDVSGAWLVFYTLRGHSETHAGVAEGFGVDVIRFASTILTPAFRESAFFPQNAADEVPNDSLVALTVSVAGTPSLFRSAARYPPLYEGTRDIFPWDPGSVGFTATMAMNPAVAGRLVVGGVPSTPVPMFIALLASTVLLVGLAFALAWRASELARQRTDFTSSVSHELRTPLTQILMYSEMLELNRERSKRERAEALHIIVREASRLMHLVENILHFSRAERRIVHVTLREQPLAPLVDGVVEDFGALVAGKGVRLRAEVASTLVARADGEALRHVLLNVLDNAVRYGPALQTIVVGASCNADQVTLWVDDSGPGVPAADRERIFEPFVRLQRDMTGVSGGSGIGLAVVKELVAQLDGTCGVEEAPGGGARFFVRLRGGARVGRRERRRPALGRDRRSDAGSTTDAG